MKELLEFVVRGLVDDAQAVAIQESAANGQTTYRDDSSDPPVVITLEARDSVKIVEVRPEPKTGLERAIERTSAIGSPGSDGDAA